jgi:hypothetical protein
MIHPLAIIVRILSGLIYFGQVTATYAASQATMQEVDAIVQEAGSVDGLLASSEIQDKYFLALKAYYGNDERFTRGSFDAILGQLRRVAQSLPSIKDRLWEEIPRHSFAVQSDVKTHGRLLNAKKWAQHIATTKDELNLAAEDFNKAHAMVAGEPSPKPVQSAIATIETHIANFEKDIATLPKKTRELKRVDFYKGLENDESIKSLAAKIVADHLAKTEVAEKLSTTNPDILIDRLMDLTQNPHKLIQGSDGDTLKKTPPGLIRAIKKQLPDVTVLLQSTDIFPVATRLTNEGQSPVLAGNPGEYRFTTIPRRIHGIFKGVVLNECVGGSCSDLSSLSPERWATSALKGSRVIHVTQNGSYLGFIQEIPIVNQKTNKIYSSLDIGVPQFSTNLITVDKNTGNYQQASLFERWIANAGRTAPNTLSESDQRRWSGYVMGKSAAINNANALPAARGTAAYSLFGKPVGMRFDFEHYDPLGDKIPGIVSPRGHAVTYGGSMIFDAFVPDSAPLTKLGAVDPEVVRNPARFKALLDRAKPEVIKKSLDYLATDNPLDPADTAMRQQVLASLQNHKDIELRVTVCRNAFRRSMPLPGCYQIIKEALLSPTSSPFIVRWSLDMTEGLRPDQRVGVIRDFLATNHPAELKVLASELGLKFGLPPSQLVEPAKNGGYLRRIIQIADRFFPENSNQRDFLWDLVNDETPEVRHAAQAAITLDSASAMRLLRLDSLDPKLISPAINELNPAEFDKEGSLELFGKMLDESAQRGDSLEGQKIVALAYSKSGGHFSKIPKKIVQSMLSISNPLSISGSPFFQQVEEALVAKAPGYLELIDSIADESQNRSVYFETLAARALLDEPELASDPKRHQQIRRLFNRQSTNSIAEIIANVLARDKNTPWRGALFDALESVLVDRLGNRGALTPLAAARLLNSLVPILQSDNTKEQIKAGEIVSNAINKFGRDGGVFYDDAGLKMDELLRAGDGLLNVTAFRPLIKVSRGENQKLAANFVAKELAKDLLPKTEIIRWAQDNFRREETGFGIVMSEIERLPANENTANLQSALTDKPTAIPSPPLMSPNDIKPADTSLRQKKIAAGFKELIEENGNFGQALRRISNEVFLPEFHLEKDLSPNREAFVGLVKMLMRGEYDNIFQKFPIKGFDSSYHFGSRIAAFRESLSLAERENFDRRIRASLIKALKRPWIFTSTDRIGATYWSLENLGFLNVTAPQKKEIQDLLLSKINARTSFGGLAGLGSYQRNLALEALYKFDKIADRIPFDGATALKVLTPPNGALQDSATMIKRINYASKVAHDPEVAEKIIDLINHKNPRIRIMAIESLAAQARSLAPETRSKLKKALIQFMKSGYALEIDAAKEKPERKFSSIVADFLLQDDPEFANYASVGKLRHKLRVLNPLRACAKAWEDLF